MGGDHTLDIGYHAEPRHDAGSDVITRTPRRDCRELQERRVAVEQQLDALAGEELAPLSVTLHVARATATDGDGLLLVEERDAVEHARAVGRVERRARIDLRLENLHRAGR